MPQRHQEFHFTASDTLRDIIIGVSDGLTVPFALAAGLSVWRKPFRTEYGHARVQIHQSTLRLTMTTGTVPAESKTNVRGLH